MDGGAAVVMDSDADADETRAHMAQLARGAELGRAEVVPYHVATDGLLVAQSPSLAITSLSKRWHVCPCGDHANQTRAHCWKEPNPTPRRKAMEILYAVGATTTEQFGFSGAL